MLRPDKQLRAFYVAKTRSLDQAAHAASEIAAAEHLPITAAHRDDPERWHRENILKVVPVYGSYNGRSERVPASAHLVDDRAVADLCEWSDLKVKGTDFQHYLDWLHGVW